MTKHPSLWKYEGLRGIAFCFFPSFSESVTVVCFPTEYALLQILFFNNMKVFIAASALAAVAAVSASDVEARATGGAVVPGFVASFRTSSSLTHYLLHRGDATILQYALTLEHLEGKARLIPF